MITPLAVAALALRAIDAFAQDVDSAASETLFREGKHLLDQKDFAHACPKLAESFRLEAATGTLLALARCHEGEGKIASAWAEYADAAARARREGRPDREQAAEQWAASLEPKLSTLTITVPDTVANTSGLTVKRDGVAIGTASWGTAVPIDQGEHVVEASATGKKPWTRTIAIRASSVRESVSVPPLEDVPAEAPIPNAVERRGLAPWQSVGLVSGGLGVVALGVGAYYGIRALQKRDESNVGCDENNACDPGPKQTRLDARTDGDISTVALAAGGALVVGGAIMYFAGADRAPKHGRIHAAPSVGRGDVGLLVWGAF
jgi:hypothetical protein